MLYRLILSKDNIPDFITGLGDSGRATANLAMEAVGDNPVYFRRLLDISFNEPYPACMRASRVAMLCCEKKPEFLYPYLDEVVEKISGTKAGGVKRNFLKVINDFIGPDKLQEPGILVQHCFDWLMSLKEDTAVRILSAEILYKVTLFEPDHKPELISTIEFAMEEGTVGFKNICGKILRLLRK
jgi:hypothetical protein